MGLMKQRRIKDSAFNRCMTRAANVIRDKLLRVKDVPRHKAAKVAAPETIPRINTGYVITGTGERFLSVRALPGKGWTCKVGDPLSVEGSSFIVRRVNGRRILLEGADNVDQ